jgi:hypothetical protein
LPLPTEFTDLNELLAELVAGARGALGGGFVGAYLWGSFALGAADEASDVDFVVVTEGEPEDERALQELHGRLFARETPWAQHLEGSYAPRALLRRVDTARTPLLYLNNGARRLVRDPHCNTAVMRWVLRERGIVLAGPPPRGLVDPVPEEALRAEARETLRAFAAWVHDEGAGFSRWDQPYAVLQVCRCLWTLAHGTVAAKPQAAAWALETLDPRWRPLIRGAVDDRPDPWRRVHEPADAAAVAETRAFAGEALRRP